MKRNLQRDLSNDKGDYPVCPMPMEEKKGKV